MPEQEGLAPRVTILQGTLAKAIGIVGGYIATSAPLVDFI
jgi:5-aminolevulinate synthase